jgi:hypothetical protein
MANGGCALHPPQTDDYQKRKVKLDSVTIHSRFLNLPNGSPDNSDLGKTVQ